MKLNTSKSPVVLRNTIANYAANLSAALIAFFFIPVYIRYLGIGSYGIIGFFTTLQMFLAFLDLGIGMALNREMSRYYHDPVHIDYLRRLTYSLQIIYFGVALTNGLGLFFMASFFSENWFSGNEVSANTLYTAFVVLSVTVTVRWPYALYAAGIRGMQRQVMLNMHDLFWNLIKSFGSWFILKYYNASLSEFLWFQCLVTFLQTLGTFVMLWYHMPKSPGMEKLAFEKKVVKNIGRYAAGMGAASLLGGLLMQLDKLLVSKMVKPSQFGYYMVATNVATLVYNASLPIYISIFPHFARLAHQQETERIKKDFHFYCSLLSTIMMPFSAIIFFAANEILWLWTKDRALASATAPILRLLIVATTLNALITNVHALLHAYSRVRLMLYIHIASSVLIVPLALVLINLFGIRGGAWSMVILCSANFAVQAPVIFRNLKLRQVVFKWYARDIFQVLLPVAVVIFAGTHYWLSGWEALGKTALVVRLAMIGLAGYVVAFLANDFLRKKLLRRKVAVQDHSA